MLWSSVDDQFLNHEMHQANCAKQQALLKARWSHRIRIASNIAQTAAWCFAQSIIRSAIMLWIPISQWTFECISKTSNSNLIWSHSNLLYVFTTALSLHVHHKLPHKSRYPMQFIELPVNHVSTKCVQNNRHKPARQKIAETDVIKSKEFESEKEKNF